MKKLVISLSAALLAASAASAAGLAPKPARPAAKAPAAKAEAGVSGAARTAAKPSGANAVRPGAGVQQNNAPDPIAALTELHKNDPTLGGMCANIGTILGLKKTEAKRISEAIVALGGSQKCAENIQESREALTAYARIMLKALESLERIRSNTTNLSQLTREELQQLTREVRSSTSEVLGVPLGEAKNRLKQLSQKCGLINPALVAGA